jgi:gluconate 2-dehydrogenase subunit 3-like protein
MTDTTGDMNRRDLLRMLGVGVAAATISCSPEASEKAHESAQAARDTAAATGNKVATKFFTPHEHDTVTMLADMIIPKDDRSGSASDAGVPEFMDYILTEYPDGQTAIRGGLAWLDAECEKRFEKQFTGCTEAQRKQVLDDIAWPKKARPELSQGVAFFNRFRDFTASGFFSSKMGTEDLKYIGNAVVPVWNGCPPEALAKLGVSYNA